MSAHLATIVECSEDAIFSRALDGTILSWNAGAERLYGYEASEIVGTKATGMIPPERAHELTDDWARLKRGEPVPPYETVRLMRDGAEITVFQSLSPLKDAAGNLEGAAVIARDITPFRRIEEALRRSENRLRAIIELEPECIAILDAQGEVMEMNRSGLDMLEVQSIEEIRQHGLMSFVLPAHREAFMGLHRTVMAGQRGELEYDIAGRNGTRRSVHTCAVPFPESVGDRPAMLALTRDDTDRKRAEQALRESEAEMRLLADSVPALICYLDAGLRCRYANRHYAEFFGYEMHEIPGKHLREIAGDEIYEQLRPRFEEALDGKPTSYERSVNCVDGEVRYIDVKLYPRVSALGKVHGVYAAGIDITERKSADEARANLAAIVQCSNDAIISRSLDGYITSWNRGAERMFGYTWREAIGQHVGFLLPLGEIAHTRQNNEIILRGEATPAHEERRLAKDGRVIDVMISHSPMRNDVGEVTGASVIFHDLTAMRQAEAALRESEERFRAAFDQASVGMALRSIDADSPRWLRVNQKLCDMLGYTREELLELDAYALTPVEDIAVARSYSERLARGELASYVREKRYVRRNGDVIWVSLSLSVVRDASNEPAYIVSVIEDITERKRAEEQLVLASEAIAATAEGILITDANRRIVSVNRAFTRITGYEAHEVVGATPEMLSTGRHDEGLHAEIWDELARSGHWQGEIWNRRKNGEAYAELMTISAVKNAEDRITHYVGVFNDISPLKEYEARLEYLAHHDALTGLPTRPLLRDRVEVAIAHAAREDTHHALLFVDLDRYKLINDSMGHEVGDQLLQAVSLRLKDILRESDTVSRHGGDEFLVLLPLLHSIQDAGRVAEKIIEQLGQPYELDDHEVIITGSIGIAVYPENGKDLDLLLRNADAAMYAAKQAGRNRYQYYSESMNAQAADRLMLEHELRHALDRGELHAVYQPQVNLASGQVVGVEALMRWNHPRLGMVSPARFIPVAEESGQIVVLGEWMMRESCRQRAEWQRRNLIDAPVAVNVSAIQLRQPNFVSIVQGILDETGLDAAYLELEVTESLLMQGTDAMVARLHALHRLGVRIALDDFGTGYSSLSYLRQFPLDRMKIDQCFVRDLPHNDDAAVITEAIATLGRALGLRVIAEGVETEQQAEFLRDTWCQDAQGYLYCRPLAPAAFELWLRREHSVARPGLYGDQ
jgi:diguanylate cyclase (GGDEF)-like protein/PAS domain S-box-containing protein